MLASLTSAGSAFAATDVSVGIGEKAEAVGVAVEDAVRADLVAVGRKHAPEGRGVDLEELFDTRVVPSAPVEDDRQLTLRLAMLRGAATVRGGVLLAGGIVEARLGLIHCAALCSGLDLRERLL